MPMNVGSAGKIVVAGAPELDAQLGGLPGEEAGFGSHWHHPTTRITERKGTLMKIGWGGGRPVISAQHFQGPLH